MLILILYSRALYLYSAVPVVGGTSRKKVKTAIIRAVNFTITGWLVGLGGGFVSEAKRPLYVITAYAVTVCSEASGQCWFLLTSTPEEASWGAVVQ